MKYNSYLDLKDVYEGSTVYLLGNGADILDLPPSFREKLENEVTIGTNASHIFLQETNFYIAGHWCHLLPHLYSGSVKDCRIFQGPHKSFFGYEENNVLDLESNNVKTCLGDFRRPEEDADPLIGAEQIGLSSTHIAWVLGAKKIIYLGFDCKSLSHFYSRGYYNSKIKDEYVRVRNFYIDEPDIKSDFDDFWNINIEPNSIPGAYSPDQGTFYLKNYDMLLGSYSEVFKKLNSEGVETVTYNENSILFEAGAALESFDE